jgi:hypothetical protein
MYELTHKQKQILNNLADDIIMEIKNDVGFEDKCMDLYDTSDGKLDNNKLTAIIWYIGGKLISY